MLAEQLAFLRAAVPQVPPVPPSTRRPFWSVVIPTYGRPVYLEQSLRCVLAQDPGPEEMSIDVVDDASPNLDLEALVQDVGGGRARYRRQPANLGTYGNINAALPLTEGRWIHVLNDDDWVQPGFYAHLRDRLPLDGPIGAALTAICITSPDQARQTPWPLIRDTPGEIADALRLFGTTASVQTPAVVVRRDVYETLGAYNTAYQWCADWEMWQRIASHYRWWYEPSITAFYRDHASSISQDAKRTGRNIAEVRTAIAFAQNYLPPDQADAIRRSALSYWAAFAARAARRMLREGHWEAAAAQIAECLRTEPSERMIRALLSLNGQLPPKVG